MKFEESIKQQPGEIIKKLVAEILRKDFVDIHFDFLDEDQWAIITTHDEEDRQISVRMHADDQLDLYCGYYDEEDEFIEIVQPLPGKESNELPGKLKKLMKKVVADEEGMRVRGSIISK